MRGIREYERWSGVVWCGVVRMRGPEVRQKCASCVPYNEPKMSTPVWRGFELLLIHLELPNPGNSSRYLKRY